MTRKEKSLICYDSTSTEYVLSFYFRNSLPFSVENLDTGPVHQVFTYLLRTHLRMVIAMNYHLIYVQNMLVDVNTLKVFVFVSFVGTCFEYFKISKNIKTKHFFLFIDLSFKRTIWKCWLLLQTKRWRATYVTAASAVLDSSPSISRRSATSGKCQVLDRAYLDDSGPWSCTLWIIVFWSIHLQTL